MAASQVAMPELPTGLIKTFGGIGPKYEIGHLLRQSTSGDWFISIVLVETGERTEYLYSQMLKDPEAA
jgi:hypothetical protein